MSGLLAGPVILGYARYLGIDPETEPTLVDIARKALTEPMPEGWERHLNEDYQMPFFWSETAGTCWEHPLLAHYLSRVEVGRQALRHDAPPPQREAPHGPPPPPPGPPGPPTTTAASYHAAPSYGLPPQPTPQPQPQPQPWPPPHYASPPAQYLGYPPQAAMYAPQSLYQPAPTYHVVAALPPPQPFQSPYVAGYAPSYSAPPSVYHHVQHAAPPSHHPMSVAGSLPPHAAYDPGMMSPQPSSQYVHHHQYQSPIAHHPPPAVHSVYAASEMAYQDQVHHHQQQHYHPEPLPPHQPPRQPPAAPPQVHHRSPYEPAAHGAAEVDAAAWTSPAIEHLQQEQHSRYREQMQRLGQAPSEAASEPPPGSKSKQAQRAEQRRKQWQQLQEQQHREIEEMRLRGEASNTLPADLTAASARPPPAPPTVPYSEGNAAAAPPLGYDVSAPPSRGRTEGGCGPLMPSAPPMRPPDLPPPQQPPPPREPPPRMPPPVSLALNPRRVSLESGLPANGEEELPSLREMAAPLVGLVGRGIGELRRRGTAAAAAAAAAYEDGGSAAAAARAAAALVAPPTHLEPLPAGAAPPPNLNMSDMASCAPPLVSQHESAAASVAEAMQTLRATCAQHTASVATQREALSSAAARAVQETIGIARERYGEASQQLGAEIAVEEDGDGAGGESAVDMLAAEAARHHRGRATLGGRLLATSAVDACAALREAREACQKEAEQIVRKFDKRVEALRTTTLDELPSTWVKEATREGSAHTALAEAEKGLRDVDSAAAFELEQELFRSGLRGEALQARLRTELNTLRGEWIEHKAAVEASVEEEARTREAKRAGLAAYVEASVLNAAAHSVGRLSDVAIAAGGQLTAIALRALHQRAIAAMREQSVAMGSGGAQWRHGACVIAASDSSSSNGDEGATHGQLALSHVLEVASSAEALAAQLLCELSTLMQSLREARSDMSALAKGETDLCAVAAKAGEEAHAAKAGSERAVTASRERLDVSLRELRGRAIEAFSGGVVLAFELGEGVAVGAFLRVSPSLIHADAPPHPPAAPPPAPTQPPAAPPPAATRPHQPPLSQPAAMLPPGRPPMAPRTLAPRSAARPLAAACVACTTAPPSSVSSPSVVVASHAAGHSERASAAAPPVHQPPPTPLMHPPPPTPPPPTPPSTRAPPGSAPPSFLSDATLTTLGASGGATPHTGLAHTDFAHTPQLIELDVQSVALESDVGDAADGESVVRRLEWNVVSLASPTPSNPTVSAPVSGSIGADVDGRTAVVDDMLAFLDAAAPAGTLAAHPVEDDQPLIRFDD